MICVGDTYKKGRQIGTMDASNGLYKINNKFFKYRFQLDNNKNFKTSVNYRMSYKHHNPAHVAHLRLGCINARYLKQAIERKTILGLDNITNAHINAFDECPCIGCITAARAKFSTSRTRGKQQLSSYRQDGKEYHPGEYAIDFAGPIPQGRLMHRHIFTHK